MTVKIDSINGTTFSLAFEVELTASRLRGRQMQDTPSKLDVARRIEG